MSSRQADPEMHAMSAILAAVRPLTHVARCRVLDYVTSRIETEHEAETRLVSPGRRLGAGSDGDDAPEPLAPPSQDVAEAPLFARQLVQRT